VDAALSDAKLMAKDIDKIVLVGGSSRTPLVQQMLESELGQKPHQEIDPDLCVAMGAAVQGGMIAGVEVGPVLVDITPHTMGVRCLGSLYGVTSRNLFSPIIQRNTPLPAIRTEVYYTQYDGQQAVEIEVYQGEEPDVRHNKHIGRFLLEGLDESAEEGSEILVKFELNLDGILDVTATERATALAKKLRIENALTQFRATDRDDVKSKLAEFFSEVHSADSEAAADRASGAASPQEPPTPDHLRQRVHHAVELLRKAAALVPGAPQEDAEEMQSLIGRLEAALSRQAESDIEGICEQLEDVVFYLEDA
jgi:molecular chaperone DnaK